MDPIQIFNETDSEHRRATNEKKLKTEKELIKALEMRQASFETFSETKKRKKSDIDTPLKRRSSPSHDYMIYFYEKSERERTPAVTKELKQSKSLIYKHSHCCKYIKPSRHSFS